MKTLSMFCSFSFIVLWVFGIIHPINLFATIFLVTVIVMGYLPSIDAGAHSYKE